MMNSKIDISTYALRYVRRLLLKNLCDENHPVLIVENHLVSEAARLIRNSPVPYDEAVFEIKKIMIARILMMSEETSVRSDMIEIVSRDKFEELRKTHL